MLRFGSFLVLAVLATTANSPDTYGQDASTAAVPGDAAGQHLVTQFYDVSYLVASQQPPVSVGSNTGDNSPAIATTTTPVSGGLGGGQGGLGGGGMGGFGGGGLGGGQFSVPAEPGQFGGSGGEGGMGGFQLPWPHAGGTSVNASTVAGLIQRIVAPDSWDTVGGVGVITVFGNVLIVRQTQAIQRDVSDLLTSLTDMVAEQQSFQLEAWWLPVSETVQGELKGILNGAHIDAAMTEKLTALCNAESGFHGTLRCREFAIGKMDSGEQTPVVAGSTPVVGAGSSGDQPVVQLLHLGLMLEARISSLPVHKSADSTPGGEEVVDLSFSSMSTNRDLKIEFCDAAGKIDRYRIGRHRAEGSCRLPLGQPTVVASLTQLFETDRNMNSESELQLIVCVTRPSK